MEDSGKPVQLFYGEHEHGIDDKKRLTIPARFRSRLAAGVVVSKGIERCLWMHPQDGWEKLAAQIGELPKTQPEARDFRRRMFASAFDIEPDKQGRITLPAVLMEYANLDKSAIVIGQHDYCEIWNPDDWRQLQSLSQDDVQGRVEMFARLGI